MRRSIVNILQAIERRDYKLPSGAVVDFYLRIESPGACVLALTEDNKIITLPQYRPGPNAIFRELPGGKVDKNEDPRKAALRELLEETGYRGDAEEWAGTWQNDAYTQMSRTVIIAKNCRRLPNRSLKKPNLVKLSW